MGYTITLTNQRGDVLAFDFDKRILREHDGLGMPPVILLTQRGVTQDGSTFRDAYLDERRISLTCDLIEDNEVDLWESRLELSRFFASLQDACYLDVVTPSAVSYRIDIRFAGELSLPRAPTDAPISQRVALLLWAGETFYNVVMNVDTLVAGGGGAGLAIPLPVPFTVGASALDTTALIAYDGTWKSYPLVRIAGPIEDPIVENETTGRTLDFTGATIADGDYLVIDCAAKTVVDQDAANQFALLTAASDIGEFYLAAHPEVTNGGNSIRITGSSVGPNVRVIFSYHDRFIGV